MKIYPCNKAKVLLFSLRVLMFIIVSILAITAYIATVIIVKQLYSGESLHWPKHWLFRNEEIEDDKYWFASTEDLKVLLDVHSDVVSRVEEYILKEKNRIDEIKKLLEPLKIEKAKAQNDPKYVENPINAFKLILSLLENIKLLESKIEERTPYERNDSIVFPQEHDLLGAKSGIRELINVYRLNISQVLNGVINQSYSEDKQNHLFQSTPMSTSETLHLLSSYLLTNTADTDALKLIIHALDGMDTDQLHPSVESDLVSFINKEYTSKGEIFSRIPKLLKSNNLIHRLKELYAAAAADPSNFTLHQDKDILQKLGYKKSIRKSIKALCRGDIELPKHIEKNLSCFYQSGPHPFLHLARVKVEQLYTEPTIVRYHNIISDGEIHELKQIAMSEMKWSTTSLNREHSYYRTSKTAFVGYEQSVAASLQRRMWIITGLGPPSESLQVANYGLGGLYYEHTDAFGTSFEETDYRDEGGDRLSTFLFYLSEVSQGGATVFVYPGVTVWPVKGSAVYWINLHDAAKEDSSTEHAGCPVLVGNKWVSTMWKPQVGHELVDPCPLRPRKLCVRQINPKIPDEVEAVCEDYEI